MTNAVFSALPTFTMCTFLLPKTLIKQKYKFRKHCLWRGNNINNKAPPKAAWKKLVCVPKINGGLGVLNLTIQNQSLLLKHLHKFFNKKDVPWVHQVWERHYSNGRLPGTSRCGSFWWRDIVKLLESFKGMARVTVQNGSTCFLWQDLWSDQILDQAYPELHSYAITNSTTVRATHQLNEIHDLFHLPLSKEAF